MSPRVAAFRQGAIDILPLMLGVVPFALLMGALATQKGLSPLEVALMSALVFAGGSQFLAVELWRDPTPVGLLALMALLVNIRHVLMGAALVPRFAGARDRDALASLFVMADETWALTLASERRGADAVAYLAGLGSGLWLNWVFWTTAGALAGALVRDPVRYGLDFAFVAVFLVLLKGLWRGPAVLAPWLASGVAAAAVKFLVPGPWYVAAGAMAGVGVAALTVRRVP